MEIHLHTEEIEELKSLMEEDEFTGAVEVFAREMLLEACPIIRPDNTEGICIRKKSKDSFNRRRTPL